MKGCTSKKNTLGAPYIITSAHIQSCIVHTSTSSLLHISLSLSLPRSYLILSYLFYYTILVHSIPFLSFLSFVLSSLSLCLFLSLLLFSRIRSYHVFLVGRGWCRRVNTSHATLNPQHPRTRSRSVTTSVAHVTMSEKPRRAHASTSPWRHLWGRT